MLVGSVIVLLCISAPALYYLWPVLRSRAPKDCPRPRKHGIPGQLLDRPSAWVCGCSNRRPQTLAELEEADIAWRLKNDADWAEVFGSEYRSTGKRKHTECGGPHGCIDCNIERRQDSDRQSKKYRTEFRVPQVDGALLRGDRDSFWIEPDDERY